MVFGGKIKFGDVIGGVAKSLDDRLKDNIKRTNDRSERIREYHVTRGQRKQEEFEKEQKELGEVLETLSNYMDKAGITIPEGMTKADFAAQLYKFGGGTITDGKKLIADLDEHYKKKGDIKGLIDQASLVTKGKGFGDYVNNFVRRPETMIKVPANLKGGVGFLKDVDITKGISEEMSTMFGDTKQADKFDVSGLFLDRTKMVTAEKYAKEQKATDLAIQQAEAEIKKTLAEADLKDAFTASGFLSKIERDKKALARARGVQLDNNDNIDIKSAKEKKIDISTFQADFVKMIANTGNTATGTFTDKRNISIVVSQASVKDDKGKYLIQPKAFPTKRKDLVIGTVYAMKNNATGESGPHIYLGQGIPPIPLYK